MRCASVQKVCVSATLHTTYVYTYLVYQNLLCGTFICHRLFWQLGLKLGCIYWTGRSVTNDFPKSTDIIQVVIEWPTNKRHIKAPQDRLLWHTHVDNKKKCFIYVFYSNKTEAAVFSCKLCFLRAFLFISFLKNLFKCVTRPDLSWVPLSWREKTVHSHIVVIKSIIS